MPRSRIFCIKSKWSRLAVSTQITSSYNSSSQLLGVRRSCARPGAQTMTLRSWPTSECTPYAAPWVFAMLTSLASNRDVAGREAVNADDRADDCDREDDPLNGCEDPLVLLLPGPKVEQGARRVEDCR